MLLVGMVLAFVVGEGLPNVLRQPPYVAIEFVGIGLMLAGFVIGWRREAIGGATAIIGFGTFAVTELIVNQHLPAGAIWLFVVPGFLLLASSGMRLCTQPRNR